MKYYISYFYQIRNMKPNMLPMSTAMYDPKWFHNNLGNGYRYFDKNGVINGVRIDRLIFDKSRYDFLIDSEADCQKVCQKDQPKFYENNGWWCPFMCSYAYNIREKNPDFNEFITFCDRYVDFLNQKLSANIDTIIFIVHEPTSVICGERPVLQHWFKENGFELKEWNKNEIL